MQRNSLTTLGIENKENKTKLVFIINMFLFIGEGWLNVLDHFDLVILD